MDGPKPNHLNRSPAQPAPSDLRLVAAILLMRDEGADCGLDPVAVAESVGLLGAHKAGGATGDPDAFAWSNLACTSAQLISDHSFST